MVGLLSLAVQVVLWVLSQNMRDCTLTVLTVVYVLRHVKKRDLELSASVSERIVKTKRIKSLIIQVK